MQGASTIMEVPWSLYRTFVIEHRHGFNKQTLSLFFADVAKGIALGAVLMPPVIVAVTRILQVWEQCLCGLGEGHGQCRLCMWEDGLTAWMRGHLPTQLLRAGGCVCMTVVVEVVRAPRTVHCITKPALG
eukprot:115346-Chlamydomonas_euryale.AAC.1